MDTLQKTVLIGHTLIALLIIALVLLQRGKGADAGAAFGAGASGTVFGSRGSGSFFSRATAVCATAFFVTSLTLAYLSSQNSAAPSSLVEEAPVIKETAMPDTNIPTIALDADAIDADDDMPYLTDAEVDGASVVPNTE
ncbi:MAG: preprotein translocase subunit SecG [Gammaproteobacteria bacterium]|jgi:preprotein translocase subunit SecG|nr:preprotein translocase subunit SecG [Gammaproteobacteria bacterium]